MSASCPDLLVVIRAGHGLALVPARRRYAVLAGLRHRRLDKQLAGGAAPEGSRQLATRAGQLVAGTVRRRIAQRWQRLLAGMDESQPTFGRRAPSGRSPAEVVDELARLVDALRADRPATAHGVALAARLLPVAKGGARRLGLGGEDVVAAAVRTVHEALG